MNSISPVVSAGMAARPPEADRPATDRQALASPRGSQCRAMMA